MRLVRACVVGGVVAVSACSASGGGGDVGSTGGSAGQDASAGTGGGGSGGDASVKDQVILPDTTQDQNLNPDTGCATSVAEAKQAPAAMMVVLDKSSSMAQANKWAFAGQAVVQAIDNDAFDTMWLGLYAAPTATIPGPSCLMGLPVPCEAPAFPQIPLELAGTAKTSDPNSVRGKIMWFVSNVKPAGGQGDASPMYAALQNAISALQTWNEDGKRLLLLVTDGTLSCNQFSNRPGFADCNGCDHDWEDPNNIVDLLAKANTDASKPIESFVVGVPGSDSYDQSACNYPPYHMRLALSAMAYAGSPTNVDPNCTGTTFTQGGGDPGTSCHFDMTQGNFNAQALADIINQIRGKTLGCVYELPVPESGTVDKTRVNVQYSTGGGPMTDLLKRSDPNDTCTNDGCWDYDANGKVILIGKACDSVKSAVDAKVQIVVGCQTNVK
ncbi:MAG: VWA domain-containing protein [Deltaproteobacteria bacterium]|nr:VWA domain-containing protein [Deltaproteobacteria bacterium]